MTYRHRVLRVLLLSGVLGAAVGCFAAIFVLRATAEQRTVERLRAETALVARSVQQPGRDWDAAVCASDVARNLGLRVTLVADDGTVLGDSARDAGSLAAMDNHLERPEIRDARLRGSGEDERLSATTNVRYYYCASKVAGNGPVRYVRLALPSTELNRVPAPFTFLVVLGMVTGMLLLIVAGYLTIRRQSRPLEQMADSLERSAAGDLRATPPMPTRGGDEMQRLAGSVRRLQLALLDKLDELDDERSLLFSVIAGMREGLLLVDAERRVRVANAALKRILDLSIDPQGHRLEEVVRHPSVVRDIDAALEQGREIHESVIRLPGSDRVFDLHVAPLTTPKRAGGHQVLVLFVDITRLDRLEKVRREFVANVSHELRTPLTSIKAFVENLIDGGLADPESSRKFLEIVRRHADHMGELIEDLTDLSLIETGSVTLELRRVDACDVAREIAEQLRPLARARDVDVRIALPAPFPVTADRRRLEQMLTNLLNNAIKFNREGGRVVIDGLATAESTSIVVEDTGIGIPSNCLAKVFERFFQVSRDRSRAVGGTGLGLSIVKHLMRLHGGRVLLESELGHGSRFTLEFPTTDAERRVVPLTLAR